MTVSTFPTGSLAIKTKLNPLHRICTKQCCTTYYYVTLLNNTAHVGDCMCNHKDLLLTVVIHGHHIYKAIWKSVDGEKLNTERETGNHLALLAMAVIKLLAKKELLGIYHTNISTVFCFS